MKGFMKTASFVLLILAVLSIGPVVKYMNYRECRAHGFSFMFCITH